MYFGVKGWRKSNMIWDALYIKDFLQFISLKKCLTHIYFTVKSILL